MAKRKPGGDVDRGDADQPEGKKVRRKGLNTAGSSRPIHSCYASFIIDITNQNKSLNNTCEVSSYKWKARGEKASAKPPPLSKVPLNVYIEVRFTNDRGRRNASSL